MLLLSSFATERISPMSVFGIHHYAAGRLFRAPLAVWLILLSGTLWAEEERFAVLQIGARTYTNVTVTTKRANYIFIVHAGGMNSIKTAELPLEIRQALGYAVPAKARASTNTAAAWAKREIGRVSLPQVKELGVQMGQKWKGKAFGGLPACLSRPKLVAAAVGIALLLYLFQSYCCLLICRKTGNQPGILVWLPGLQLLPLLRAAGMSGWWFLAFFVPLLNLVAGVLWCLNIAKARGKSIWVGILLLLPVTNLFAFLYLAFSSGVTAEEDEGHEPKIMTL